MGWGKICGSLSFHRKTLAAGNEAMGVWVRMLAWTCDNETDGFVRADAAFMIAGRQEPLDALIAARWIEAVPGGYSMRNHLKHNMSKAESDALKAERREAGRRGGIARAIAIAKQRDGVARAIAKTYQTPTPTPTPTPNPPSGGRETCEVPQAALADPRPFGLEPPEGKKPRSRKAPKTGVGRGLPASGPDGPITQDAVRELVAYLGERSGVSQAVQPPSPEWWMVWRRLSERPMVELKRAIELACADPFRRKSGRTSLRSILATDSTVAEALALGAPGGGGRATTREEREREVFRRAIEKAKAKEAAPDDITATDVRRTES